MAPSNEDQRLRVALLAATLVAGAGAGFFVMRTTAPTPPLGPADLRADFDETSAVTEARTPTAPTRGEQRLPQTPALGDGPLPLLPVRCDLPVGDPPPATVSVSWRAVVLDDPALSSAALAERVAQRRTVASWTGLTYAVDLPPQADVLLVFDGDRIAAAVGLSWTEDAGSCRVQDVQLRTVDVVGRVEGLLDGDQVDVFVCGEWFDVGQDGAFVATAPARGSCLAYASRQDGMLGAIGNIVELELSGAPELSLALDMPNYDMAGVGVALMASEDGAQVMQPVPGGPAEGQLQAGDLITHVDGEAIGGWELVDVVAVITGPEGSEVTLTVEDQDGQVHELTLRRAPIDEPEAP